MITIGEPLPTDGNGGDRLYRAGILATMLARSGHEVVWWSSTFDHVRKRQRFSTDKTFRLESGVLLKLLHGCGYARNVSLRRLVDHATLARKFTRQAEGMQRPDVILCSLPPLELPVAVTHYGKAHGVPVVVDVRDLWPDIFLELVPQWLRPLFNLALAPMWRQARTACRNAFAITGNAPGFIEWGLGLAQRSATDLDRYFPFGYAAPMLTDDERESANSFWGKYGLHEGDAEFTVCFFGAFSNQFDLETVVDAALMLEAEGVGVQFILCGTGERLEALKTRAGGSQAVIFPGWVGRAEIWTLMSLSDIGIAPYRNHAGFIGNLPNKPIEYMAGGLPVVSGLHGYLEELLDHNQCGVNYAPGDARALRDVIVRLMGDGAQLTVMSTNARRIFSEKFDADKVYGKMMAYLQDVVTAYASQSHSQEET
ncbi:MAG: glycosyltransferase family 4 protein [Sulfuricella sp.]